jgi:flagellar biosynthetic protein FlhB
MAADEGQEKTEQPTSKKLTDARDKGQVAKSTEINSVSIFVSGLLLLYISQSWVSGKISWFAKFIFNSLDVLTINKDLFIDYAIKGYLYFIAILAPLLIGLVVVALAANISQVGLKFATKALEPKFDKLNVFKGIKNLVSSKAFVEVAKSIFKLVLIGSFTYMMLTKLIASSTAILEFSIEEIVNFMMDSAYSLVWKLALIYILIAAADFAFQKYKFKKDMMMTKQEVKEEFKQQDGDPEIKSRIRKAQFAAARQRMMVDVPTADVVITNPTHYAIALKYDMAKDGAPTVVAKGVDELAQRIKKIAVENNVPLHEDRELARALFKMCDVGDKIPASLFKAVAQVLAYIFRLKESKKKKSII